jgi:hypothetical protein
MAGRVPLKNRKVVERRKRAASGRLSVQYLLSIILIVCLWRREFVVFVS